LNIKDFQCCGSNEWLISRSEARSLVRGFRQDLKEGLVLWEDVFGFCISCGGVFDFHVASRQKGYDVASKFYWTQIKRSHGQAFAHKKKKAGGFSKRQMKMFEKSQFVDSAQMTRFYDIQIKALDKIGQEREEMGSVEDVKEIYGDES